MSSPTEKKDVNLVISLMHRKSEDISTIVSEIEQRYGKIRDSIVLDFKFTKYYEKEFGTELIKEYLFIGKKDIETFPDIKLFCFELEKKYSRDGKRIFNIDPGYLTENSFILASFKPRAHRIYLRDSVYADLQLVYENNAWQGFKWTFPDVLEIKPFLQKIKCF